MGGYTHILFDLDGTLTDPYEGITRSLQYALRHFGMEETDETRLRAFIGPPLRESFQKRYGFTPAQSEEAVAVYRDYFSQKGLYENRVYDGIPALLADLARVGYTLAVASSKAAVYVRHILAHFEMIRLFAFAGGSELDGRRSTKEEIIPYVLEHLRVPPSASILMVGDRSYDLLGARRSGISGAGVLWGYGTAAELSACPHALLADDVQRLRMFLLPQKSESLPSE